MQMFLIYNLSEQHLIDINQCAQSPLYVKKSLNESKGFICYTSEPSFISSLTTKEGPYDYSEMMVVLEGSEWKINN